MSTISMSSAAAAINIGENPPNDVRESGASSDM